MTTLWRDESMSAVTAADVAALAGLACLGLGVWAIPLLVLCGAVHYLARLR